MSRAYRLACAVLLAGALLPAVPSATGVARASDAAVEPEDVDAKTLKTALERFEREFDTADIDFKLRAVQRFAAVQHKTIAKDLLKLLKDDDLHVRAAVAEGLGNQLTSARTVGTRLAKLIDDAANDEAEAKVVAAAVKAIGRLDWRKADEELRLLLDHPDDTVVSNVFAVWGAWKHEDALRDMYEFFERYPDEKSFKTGTVRVDTGTAGNADAKAAKAKWKAKYGGQAGWRPRPECTKALVAALKEITGMGFRRPEDLKEYLDDPKAYVDPETIAERLEEPLRKGAYAEWLRVVAEAAEIAKKEVKSDDAGDERAKVYRKHLYEMRDGLLEKRKLRLSELDVIVEEGEARGWTAAD